MHMFRPCSMCRMHSSGQRRNVKPDTRLKPSVYCEIQRDLSGGDRRNQRCVNVSDVHSCVKVLHCRFNAKTTFDLV